MMQMPCGLQRAPRFQLSPYESTVLGWEFAQETGKILPELVSMGKRGPFLEGMCWTDRHICPREPCSPSCPPGAMTHHPAQSACLRKGKSLPESRSCWSLIGYRALGRAVRNGDRTWPPLSHFAMANVGLLLPVKSGPSLAACAPSVPR